MELIERIFHFLSSLAFIYYGIDCLKSPEIISEFRRFGLAKFRILTGVLEICGGLGLILGFYFRPLLILASGGLALLMLGGVGARIRIKDPLIAILPAFTFLCINLFLFVRAFYWI